MDGEDQCTVRVCVHAGASVCPGLNVYVFADEVLRAEKEVEQEEE